MPNSSSQNPGNFVPRSLEDVFALYLSRELQDPERVRFYASLTKQHSMCLLINALRSARAHKGSDAVKPSDLLTALAKQTEGWS